MLLRYLFYNIIDHNIVWFRVPFSDLKKSFWKQLLDFFRFVIRISIKRRCRQDFGKSYHVNPILFIIGTGNNQRVLEPVYSQLPKSYYTVIDLRNEDYYFNKQYIWSWSALFIIPLLTKYIFTTKRNKRIIANNFSEIYPTIGNLRAVERLLNNNSIKLVVMANDHCSVYRAFIKLCPQYSVSTAYLQHCSIASHFPPLDFTYSFLDGQETLDKYKSIGPVKGHVYLVGNPRFDIIKQYKDNKRPQGVIGLAVNLFDNVNDIQNTCLTLIKAGFKDIYLRPHPRQELEKDWFYNHGIKFSDSKTENPFVYLSKISILIAGESGIHLDASLMGLPSVCYILNHKPSVDWYGYIKNDLIFYARNLDELLKFIDKKRDFKPNDKLLKFYNASYNSSIEGKVSTLIADFLNYHYMGKTKTFYEKYPLIELTNNVRTL